MSTPGEGRSQLKLGSVFPAESLQRLPLRLREALLASSLTPFQVIFEVFIQPIFEEYYSRLGSRELSNVELR